MARWPPAVMQYKPFWGFLSSYCLTMNGFNTRAFKGKLWCSLPGGSRTSMLMRQFSTVLLPGLIKWAANSHFEIPLLSLACSNVRYSSQLLLLSLGVVQFEDIWKDPAVPSNKCIFLLAGSRAFLAWDMRDLVSVQFYHRVLCAWFASHFQRLKNQNKHLGSVLSHPFPFCGTDIVTVLVAPSLHWWKVRAIPTQKHGVTEWHPVPGKLSLKPEVLETNQ